MEVNKLQSTSLKQTEVVLGSSVSAALPLLSVLGIRKIRVNTDLIFGGCLCF